MPIEATIESSSLTRRLMDDADSAAGPKILSMPVMSRYASSTLTGSTRGEKSRNMSMNFRLTTPYCP